MCSTLCYSLIRFYLYSLKQSLYPLSTAESHPKFVIMIVIQQDVYFFFFPNDKETLQKWAYLEHQPARQTQDTM